MTWFPETVRIWSLWSQLSESGGRSFTSCVLWLLQKDSGARQAEHKEQRAAEAAQKTPYTERDVERSVKESLQLADQYGRDMSIGQTLPQTLTEEQNPFGGSMNEKGKSGMHDKWWLWRHTWKLRKSEVWWCNSYKDTLDFLDVMGDYLWVIARQCRGNLTIVSWLWPWWNLCTK